MENPDTSLGTDPRAGRDAVLLESLSAAVNEVRHFLGPDPADWAWGKLHHAQFVHALAPFGGRCDASPVDGRPTCNGRLGFSPGCSSLSAV